MFAAFTAAPAACRREVTLLRERTSGARTSAWLASSHDRADARRARSVRARLPRAAADERRLRRPRVRASRAAAARRVGIQDVRADAHGGVARLARALQAGYRRPSRLGREQVGRRVQAAALIRVYPSDEAETMSGMHPLLFVIKLHTTIRLK